MARNLLGIRLLDRSHIEELLALSAEFKSRILRGKDLPDMSGKVIGLLFFENSTRTRVSFERASHYLKLKTANFTGGSSSMTKGETLKDTILTLRNERLDGLVMRHRASGAPTLAARFFGGPVINAGDGEHEHPTQALGDALTILERKGQLKGLSISIVGDVAHSRVARSNAWLLSKLGADVRFVGPRTLMPSQMGMLPGRVYYDLAAGIEDADVVMSLRLQKERMAEGMLSSRSEYAHMYQINRETLAYAKPDCLVMHPGPINRGVELDNVAADGDRSVISLQVENGVFVRVAALHWVFSAESSLVTEPTIALHGDHKPKPRKSKPSKPAAKKAGARS